MTTWLWLLTRIPRGWWAGNSSTPCHSTTAVAFYDEEPKVVLSFFAVLPGVMSARLNKRNLNTIINREQNKILGTKLINNLQEGIFKVYTRGKKTLLLETSLKGNLRLSKVDSPLKESWVNSKCGNVKRHPLGIRWADWKSSWFCRKLSTWSTMIVYPL